VVHEHRFEVRLRTTADFIVGKPAKRVTLLGTLVEMVGTGVELGRTRDELIALHLERADVGEEGAGPRDRRSAAVEISRRGSAPARRPGRQRAERIVAAGLRDGVLLAVGRIDGGAAALVVEQGAE